MNEAGLGAAPPPAGPGSTVRAVRIFVALKTHLTVNSMRSSPTRAVFMALGAICGCAVGVAGCWIIALQRHHSTSSSIVVFATFAVAFVGWLIIPMISFGTDDTLDPAKLSLLPLRPVQMLAGMGVASMIGVPAIMTALALSGTILGYAPAGPGAVLTVLAVVAECVMCIVGSRAVVTAMASLLRSRRGRDVGMIVLSLLGTSYFFFRAMVARSATALGTLAGRARAAHAAGGGELVAIVRWTPPGFAAEAVVDAQHNLLLSAGLHLAGAAACVALLASWWAHSLGRALVSDDRSVVTTPGIRDTEVAIAPRLLSGVVPPTRVGAVAAREIRYASRDPRRRTMWIQSAVLGLVVPLGTPAVDRSVSADVVFAACMAPLLICLVSLNSFGLDGPAMWVDVSAVDPAGRYSLAASLRGKNLAQASMAILVGLAVAVVLAALEGGWSYLPMVLASIGCVTGVSIGVGNFSSVAAPVPIPDNPSNAFATAGGGRGCATAIVQGGAIIAVGVALVPAAAVTVLALGSGSVAFETAASLFSIAYGYGAWKAGTAAAGRLLRGREPEVLAAVSVNQLT